MTEDELRELEKVRDALVLAVEFHTKTNEANAALHQSTRTLYSPLTVSLVNAQESVERLLFDAALAMAKHEPGYVARNVPDDAPSSATCEAADIEASMLSQLHRLQQK